MNFLRYLSSMASGGHSRLFNNKSGCNSFEKSSVYRDITKNIIRTQHIRMLSIERTDKLMIKLWISMMLKTLMENPLDQIWKACWSLIGQKLVEKCQNELTIDKSSLVFLTLLTSSVQEFST